MKSHAFPIFVSTALILMGLGCGDHFQDDLRNIGNDAGAIAVRAGVIQDTTKQITGNDSPKKTINDQADKIKTSAGDIQRQLDSANRSYNDLKEQFEKLNAKWFVRWGKWIENAVKILIGSWIALGVLSVIFGMGNPLSWPYAIGREIIRFLPLANPFSWTRDLINRRKATVAAPGNAAGGGV